MYTILQYMPDVQLTYMRVCVFCMSPLTVETLGTDALSTRHVAGREEPLALSVCLVVVQTGYLPPLSWL